MKKTVTYIVTFFITLNAWGVSYISFNQKDTLRTMQYTSRSESEALIWQNEVRRKLVNLLKIDDLLANKSKIPFHSKIISTENKESYVLQEIEINSTPGRRMNILVTLPKQSANPNPAVVCIHGHGGNLRSVYEKGTIYKGFADALASSGYVTIAAVVSQHQVSEAGRLLMGERLWDLIRCVDYLETLTGAVDRNRIGCAGLSLGGEMAMWLGAVDKRITAAFSSGFLTVMDQMEQNHCMCWKFPGLRHLVDFADIYSLISPRFLSCQNGLYEPADQFYLPIALNAFAEIKEIYRDLDAIENLTMNVHKGAHEIDLTGLLLFFNKRLKS